MDRVDQASKNFRSRHNCCQAVVCAYCDTIGLDEAAAKEMTANYGRGKYKGICGAVAGMYIVVNRLHGETGQDEPADWGETSEETLRELHDEFLATEGSVLCRELTSKAPCAHYVARAAALLERVVE